MMHDSRSVWRFLAAVFGLFLMVGCGGEKIDRGPLGSVQGQVTFDSAAVTEGTVQFTHTQKGYAGTGQIDQEGHYVVKSEMGGLPIGEYKVSVMPPIVQIDGGPNTPSSEGPKVMPTIPKKYRSSETSSLIVEIHTGENTFDIAMQGR